MQTGVVGDEQSARYVILDGQLVIPGVDPAYDYSTWEYGSFYRLEDSIWNTVNTIPNGIHNWDMVEFQGEIFAGLGVQYQSSPIVKTADFGETWEQIPLWRDGNEIDFEENSMIRVPRFIRYRDDLYAVFYNSGLEFGGEFYLFKYEGKAFYYLECDWIDGVIRSSGDISPIPAYVEFRNQLFYATQSLNVTQDLITTQYVPLPQICVVRDLLIENEVLYVLTTQRNEDGQYINRVYSSETGEQGSFTEVLSFSYEVPVLCFLRHQGAFYFGTGPSVLQSEFGTELTCLQNDKAGMVLRVAWQQEE